MKILVTGTAGFIGFHVAKLLLSRGDSVVGLDVVNDYYDPVLKQARLQVLEDTPRVEGATYEFVKINMADREAMTDLFEKHQFDRVINLAAQAGVRYSLTNPHAYIESNIQGFLNILEGCRHSKVEHLTYASTSSIYGANTNMPFSEHDGVDHPVALYAATKRANELMAHSYSHLYRLPTTGLRFFTVYGPWGRPDMALFIFTKKILAGEPIEIFNNGKHTRDFTYIDDIAEGVVRVCNKVAKPDLEWDSNNPDPATSNAPFRVFNIGNSKPIELLDYIKALEEKLGRKAKTRMLELQPGDIPDTYANVSELSAQVGYRPTTSVEVGVEHFVDWYMNYHGIDPKTL